MHYFLALFVTFISATSHASSSKWASLKVGCEGNEDGQIVEVLQGHVIRLEDGGAEAEYYRVTGLPDDGLKGELVFTGLRTNDHTAVTTPDKSGKTIELRNTKAKSWKVTTTQSVAGSKKPYVLTHSCKEE